LGNTPEITCINKKTKEYRVFYILDAVKAAQARKDAYDLAMKTEKWEQALKATQKRIDIVKKISDFVNEEPNLPSIADEE
jgi:sulfur relay (sulfurtransferase) complex TusBCD TusD component (DsrE family)